MHLGISTYSFPWAVGLQHFKPPNPLTPGDLLRIAEQHDIRFVQFGDNLPLHRMGETALRRLKEEADILSIQIEVGTKRLTKETIETYLPIAHLMKAPFLRMVMDDGEHQPGEAAAVEMIQSVLPRLRQAGVCLALENHDRLGAKSLRRIVEATDPHWVGICLDTANSFGAGEGVGEVVNQLAPYTLNLHIKDFTITRVPHKMGFRISGCAAGAGQLNIPWLLQEVEKWNRCRTATLEVWSDEGPTMEATLEREKAWVAQSITYLKTIVA